MTTTPETQTKIPGRWRTSGWLTKIGMAMLVFSLIAVSQRPALAADTPDVQAQRDALQQKLDQINKQISSFQGQIQTTLKQQASLKNEISIYDNQVSSTELQIQANETQIEDTTLQISQLQGQIERRETEIADNKKILSELIVQLNELDDNSYLKIGLGNNNFSDFLDQVQYTENVQGKVYQIVQSIKSIKAKLEVQQADLKTSLTKLEQLKDQLDITKSSLETQRKSRQSLLDQTHGQEKNYRTLLGKSQQEQTNLQKEMNDLDDAVRSKIGNRSTPPGKLAKPMAGVLTQGYGNTGFTSLGYTFHNGLDIAAPAGTPIYAAADGTINGTGTGEAAYGNWVTLKSTLGTRQIITLYGHMRSFVVHNGQRLSQGDLIGYEGNTGNTTRLLYGPDRGYHLHWTVCDAEGFTITPGAYQKIYGPYQVPACYTYNPKDFL